MDFSVRRVREDDAASIVELLNPIIQAGSFTIMDDPVSVEEQADFIRRFPRRGICNVAVCDDTRRVLGIQDIVPLAGSVNALRHIGEVSTFVSIDVHRAGIGRSLCSSTFREAKENGFAKLWATIRADNPQAAAFYQSQGFRVVGTAEKHALVRGKYVDEIVTEKILE